mmetsp:Transcript_6607/g.11882  ORF Transcript_6607/g.11882 Transcript_6607/m.11882 type:complete len:97 (-) Transcript_6607:367-657(-)
MLAFLPKMMSFPNLLPKKISCPILLPKMMSCPLLALPPPSLAISPANMMIDVVINRICVVTVVPKMIRVPTINMMATPKCSFVTHLMILAFVIAPF